MNRRTFLRSLLGLPIAAKVALSKPAEPEPFVCVIKPHVRTMQLRSIDVSLGESVHLVTREVGCSLTRTHTSRLSADDILALAKSEEDFTRRGIGAVFPGA